MIRILLNLSEMKEYSTYVSESRSYLLPGQPFVFINHNTFKYISLKTEIHQWFVDQDIRYDLDYENSYITILFDLTKSATLFKLTWGFK